MFFVLVLLHCATASLVLAQTGDTVLLKTISVEESRSMLFLTGKVIQSIDSSQLHRESGTNLADLLSSVSPLFIKSYGAGSSATLSARGTEARHSSVLWNGFNLNAPGLGLSDLSLIPTLITDRVSLVNGGSTPVNGNSSIGSTVILHRSEPLFQKHSTINATAGFGSFSHQHYSLQSQLENHRISQRTGIFYDHAINNFSYVNLAKRDGPTEKLQHAGLRSYGVVHDADFKIHKNIILSTAVWYQSTHREIPPMMTVPESQAEQRDSVLRLYSGLKIPFRKSSLRINGAWFREDQQYDDPLYLIHKRYFLQNFFGDGEYRWFPMQKLIVSAGVTVNHAIASFAEYQQSRQRNLYSAWSSLRYEAFQGWLLNLNLRSEFSNVADPPLCPSLGIEGNMIGEKVILLLNAGRHFNIPSMNDLYWQPGGNINLLPEDGWSGDGGFAFFKNHPQLPQLTLIAFLSDVKNWIRWLPVTGGIYTPENVSRVRTSGLESSLQYNYKCGKWLFAVAINYSYCSSQVVETKEPYADNITGRQLMYVPEHAGVASLMLGYRNLKLQYQYRYTGERFTAADHSSSLENFHLSEFYLSWSPVIHKQRLNLYATAGNLFNTDYQVMPWRPMPGRHYRLGINLQLKTLKSNP